MKERILVVDDQKLYREALKSMLQDAGFRVFLARDGLEGVQKAILLKPDLILMDVVMPNMDGFSAAREINAVSKDNPPPIVFVTSKDSASDKQTGYELGGEDYVIKPFEPRELLARVNLRLHKRREAIQAQARARAETLSQLMITIAHYINNALSVIRGRTRLIDPENSDEVRELLDTLDEQTDKIHRVIASLTDMASHSSIKTSTYAGSTRTMLDIAEDLNEQIEGAKALFTGPFSYRQETKRPEHDCPDQKENKSSDAKDDDQNDKDISVNGNRGLQAS